MLKKNHFFSSVKRLLCLTFCISKMFDQSRHNATYFIFGLFSEQSRYKRCPNLRLHEITKTKLFRKQGSVHPVFEKRQHSHALIIFCYDERIHAASIFGTYRVRSLSLKYRKAGLSVSHIVAFMVPVPLLYMRLTP